MYRGFLISRECIWDFLVWGNVSRISDFEGMYKGCSILGECIEDLRFWRNVSRILPKVSSGALGPKLVKILKKTSCFDTFFGWIPKSYFCRSLVERLEFFSEFGGMYRGLSILRGCIENFIFWWNVPRILDFEGMYRGFGNLRECIGHFRFWGNVSRFFCRKCFQAVRVQN